MNRITDRRDWDLLRQRHLTFWRCAETDRPLIGVTYDAYQDTEYTAQVCGEGELLPQRIDLAAILPVYDRMAASRAAIGDDMIAIAEPPLGIPWLEAICGCRVLVPSGKSLWPEPPAGARMPEALTLSVDNPWFGKLIEVLAAVVAHAAGRYAVSLSHLRGPADILAGRLGTERFLMLLVDEPERIAALARQAGRVWLAVASAAAAVVPAWREGYGMRQFGLWSPERSVWLQDDTSSMMSQRHYRRFFLEPLQGMSVYPYGVLHIHAPSLHLAEMLVATPNIRALNVYFDSKTVTLQAALPTLRRLQARGLPLILAKDVYAGFSLEEYDEILDGLSPRGLSVHLCAGSVAEGREVMAQVQRRSR